MKKRIIAAILCLVLLSGSALPALATEYNAVIGNFTGGKTIELTYNGYESGAFMNVGEYQIINPLHWIDPEYLSYEVVSLTTSDPLVVTAEPYNIGDREEMGIQLHATGEGDAVVNMVLRTYRTREGLKARDERITDTQKVTLYVDVMGVGGLDTEIRIISDDYDYVNDIVFGTSDAYEVLPDNLRHPMLCAVSDTLGAALNVDSYEDPYAQPKASEMLEPHMPRFIAGETQGVGALIVYLNITGTDGEAMVDLIHDDDPRYVTPSDRKRQDLIKQAALGREIKPASKVDMGRSLIKLGSNLAKAVDALKLGKVFSAGAVEGVRRKATYIPVYTPSPLTVEVKLTGYSTMVESLTLQANEFLSFTSTAGPWGDSYTINQPIEIIDHNDYNKFGEHTIKVQVFPRAAWGDLDDTNIYHIGSDDVRFAYEGKITLICEYGTGLYHYSEEKGSSRNSVYLNAYSKITKEDMQKYANSMNYNMDYFKHYFGAENLAELLYFGCPVEIIIQDTEGTELAVIKTDDAEAYENEGLLAAANGEDKILAIDPTATDLYRVYVRALEDGTMDVISTGADTEGGLDANVYEKTPISAGEVFEMRLSGEGAGKLYVIKEDGSGKEVETTMDFNRTAIEQNLREEGLSEWAAAPAANAVLAGFVPDLVCESYSDAISAEEFCEMLLKVYEAYYGLGAGVTIKNYADAYTGEGEFTALDVAVSRNLVPRTFLENERQFGDGIDRETAAEWILRLIRNALLDVNASDALLYYDRYLYYQTDEYLQDVEELKMFEGTEEEVEKILSTKARITPDTMKDIARRGIMAREMSGDAAFTYEEALAAIGETWDYMVRCAERNDLVLNAVEDTIAKLEGLDLKIYAATEEYRSDKALDPLMLHFPALSGVNINVINLNNHVNALAIPDTGDENPVNPSKPDGVDLSLFRGALGVVVSDPGRCTLEVAPVYYPDGEGGVYEDTVYLMVSRNTYGQDEDVLMITGEEPQGDYTYDMILITDQEVVAKYLELMRPVIEQYIEPEDETVYPELSKGSRGDEAKALQKALIQKGFLTGTADGIYGNMTAEAVSAFQTSVGMEATGIADHETQKLLFAVPDQKQLLLDWLDRQS